LPSIASRSLLPGWSIPVVFVIGAISQYVGAAIGVFLFETTEPATVAWLRAAAAAVALWCGGGRGGVSGTGGKPVRL
jgi:inner membrane transporter RhtA